MTWKILNSWDTAADHPKKKSATTHNGGVPASTRSLRMVLKAGLRAVEATRRSKIRLGGRESGVRGEAVVGGVEGDLNKLDGGGGRKRAAEIGDVELMGYRHTVEGSMWLELLSGNTTLSSDVVGKVKSDGLSLSSSPPVYSTF
ncbi:hypothetical protein L1987_25472 [Smallanthus sonchifolius]|uniref:Uncharacterized protein n=1 Tax=Smallanthus sonchifolius TaxID=185202 RepID=A0ACB9INV8_9ASTR|nr:hypothetical protein L1987_25472 [Smallanthus sonchifolius]